MRVSWRSIQPAAPLCSCRSSKSATNAVCHVFQSVRDPEGRVAPVFCSAGEKNGFLLDSARSSLACFALQPWLVSHPEHVSKPSHQRANENWGPPSRRGQKSTSCPSLHLLLNLRRRRRAHTRAPEMLRLSNAPSLHIAAASQRRRPVHTKHDGFESKRHRAPPTRRARRRELGPPLPHKGGVAGRRPRRRLRRRLEHDADGPGVAAH